jgi:RNA polymerase sigma factor (sigma-70 family)
MGREPGFITTTDRGDPLPEIPLALLRNNDDAAWQTAQRILWERMWRAAHRKMPLATESQLTDFVSELLCDPVVAQLFEPESDAFRAIQTFADLVNLACHITGLRAIDKIRQSIRRGGHSSLDTVPEELLTGAPEASTDDHADAIQVALQQIDGRYREPLLLHYFEGLGTQAIADRLQAPKGTVCTLLSRGRQEIRKVLESDGFTLFPSATP